MASRMRWNMNQAVLYWQLSERWSWCAEKPFLLEAARWKAAAHSVSLTWLRSMTVPVMMVKSFRHSFSPQR
jgi:hypothetical protein